jgi:hypothetical protein
MPRNAVVPALALGLALAMLAPTPGGAESDLRLDYPHAFGVVAAATYDAKRHKVGKAHLVLEQLDDVQVRIFSESGFTGGARTVITSLLERVEPEGKLRPVRQESRSFDPDGNSLGMLLIDHHDGVARCLQPDGTPRAEIPLPEEDRVANVTLNLLFLPLVRRETREVRFKLFFCGLGTRFVGFTANLAPESANGNPNQAVEVRYGPDFGFATLVAKSFLPKLSFWFDPEAPHRWMAHRLPLYGNGPEVFVVRDGVPTSWLADE